MEGGFGRGEEGGTLSITYDIVHTGGWHVGGWLGGGDLRINKITDVSKNINLLDSIKISDYVSFNAFSNFFRINFPPIVITNSSESM